MASQLDKKVLSPGNGADYPKVGDEVLMEYTGWLYDSSKADQEFKGNKSVVAAGAIPELLLTLITTGSIAQSAVEISKPRSVSAESSKVRSDCSSRLASFISPRIFQAGTKACRKCRWVRGPD